MRSGEGRTGTPRSAWLHRVPPRTSLLTLVGFAVVVVATPREWFAVFALYAVAVAMLLVAARVRPAVALRRLSIEIPFVVFALLMPFIATGPRVEVLGVPLAVEGLWGAWALLAKATLTLLAAVAFTAVTEPRRIVGALAALRMPAQLTAIIGFMLRYLDVIGEESARMRVARQSRGFANRGLRDWRTLGRGVGALFVRAHARGERVHLAMLARGYSDGTG
ncbi:MULTISPECIES: cobalt ECF transporter T component CbiQ [unclassified Microbacterium]|uniref:cobalt ECF transporter T component CbiQ n=1 Tax=unclassified Microbacterium TaxID=2609290 RepID=UPI00214C7914|nr:MULTISPECIES: cobalt ECF transporter T component CbiQ [unclassified Microbacterium]MCR2810026.1 cobalt ECF transporter T component CbiQ [Microbacterium sp. zg.B185]WIM20134.1 cobalt ECF transporter T component CbiQ [Microbacterium sp. zg-B185]